MSGQHGEKMIELKLRNIMKNVKSENPEKRYQALDQLFQYKQDDSLEIQIEVLEDMVKLAAGSFPESVDKWDNPSYYIIDFVCDYPMEEVVKSILKHFDGFHLWAKERAIGFLLSTEDEGIFHELEDKIVDLMKTTEIILPISELNSYPVLVKDILEKTIDCIHSPHYKFMVYDMLVAVNASGYEQSFKKGIVIPTLLEDYAKLKDEYKSYDQDYKTEYVYKAWKSSYFTTRYRMRRLLQVMEFYFTPETENEIKEALFFQDPMIKTEAVLICIDKNISVEPALIKECATSLESAEMLYWELRNKNREHLYPVKEEKQKLIAKARLFNYITDLPTDDDEIHYPEGIEIMDKIETENAYGQPVRFYLMSFEEKGSTFVGWVGAFSLEDGDDTAHMWDGTYTEFVELNSKSVEDHKQAFFAQREEAKEDFENYVHYESSPKLSKGLWFVYAILMGQWINAFLKGITEFYIGPVLLSVIALVWTAYEYRKMKTSKISIVGRNLVINKGRSEEVVPLHEMKKVEYTKKQILIYNRENKVQIKFPLKWVRYEQFYYHMKENTAHLKERPYIQE